MNPYKYQKSTFKKHNSSQNRWFSIFQKSIGRVLSLPISVPTWNQKKSSQKDILRRQISTKGFIDTEKKQGDTIRAIKKLLQKHRLQISTASLCVILAIWAYLIVATPYFYINNIEIHGTKEIPISEINNLVNQHIDQRNWLFIKRSHRMFLNISELDQTIKKSYSLKSLSFKPNLSAKTLTVCIEEKDPAFVYSINDQFFSIDDSGFVIRSVTATELATMNIPQIYDYQERQVSIGQQLLLPEQVLAIQSLYHNLQGYSFMDIHSFRLKPSKQQTVTITKKAPEQTEEGHMEEKDELIKKQLEDLTRSIDSADSINEKIARLKKTLDTITPERVEAGKIEELMTEQQVYQINNDYNLPQLELYTKQGWSIRFGYKILQHEQSPEELLNIFATLSGKLDIAGEVKEYIDLRFENRIYYR